MAEFNQSSQVLLAGSATDPIGEKQLSVPVSPQSLSTARIGWLITILGLSWFGIFYLTWVTLIQDSKRENLPPLAIIYDSGMMDVIEQRLEMEEE